MNNLRMLLYKCKRGILSINEGHLEDLICGGKPLLDWTGPIPAFANLRAIANFRFDARHSTPISNIVAGFVTLSSYRGLV